MTSKQTVLLHYEGIEACNQKDWLKAIALFQQIETPSAIIYFNIGCCHLQLQQFEKAEKSFIACVERDAYLAVGYFQLAVAQTLMGSNEEAIRNFNSCLKAMRNNAVIHYKQLNLPCKIQACEVRLNLALLYLFSNDYASGLEQLKLGAEIENDSNHFIHMALAATVGEDWGVFGLSPSEKLIKLDSNAVFHPSKAMLDGIKADIKFRNPPKLVSATNDDYSFVGFVGPVKLQREKENLTDSFAETHLPPPLPSVAPQRRSKPPSYAPPPHPPATPPKLSALKNIPSPPSFSPPPLLRKNRTPPAKQPPVPSTKFTESEIADKLKLQLSEQTKPAKKPPFPKTNAANSRLKINSGSPAKSRPPPPKKGSFKHNFQCNLTTSLSIPKANVKTYDEMTLAVSKKLHFLAEEIKSGTCIFYQSDGEDIAVNSASWRDIFLKGVRQSSLSLVVKDKSPQFQAGVKELGSHLPTNRSLSPTVNDSEDDIYFEAQYGGDEDEEVYSYTVY